MGTDRSPSSGSDLHRPFHRHSAPSLPETMFFHLEPSPNARAEPSAAIGDTACRVVEGGGGIQPLAAQEGDRNRFSHRGSFLEDLDP